MLRALVACLLVATPAFADETTNSQKAKVLFDEARALKAKGDVDAACKLFARSYELEAGAGTALNVAECEALAGKWEHAIELYEGAAKTFENENRAESAKFARGRAQALRDEHVPKPVEPIKQPEPTPEPEKPVKPAGKSSKIALGVGIGGITLSVIGAVIWGIDRAKVADFEDTDLSSVDAKTEPFGPPKFGSVGSGDCGRIEFYNRGTEMPNATVNSKFADACSAYSRAKYVVPMTYVAGALGVGALAYYFWTRPKKPSSVAIVPTGSGMTVTTTFEW